MEFKDFPLLRRPPLDGETYGSVLDKVTSVAEDQLLSFHMSPMLKCMGTNVRAHLYHHALSRAGFDKTPLRDALKALEAVVDEAIEHDWLQEADFEKLQDYVDNHLDPKIAENYRGRKFRQIQWDVVGCEASIGHWQQFTSEEQCDSSCMLVSTELKHASKNSLSERKSIESAGL